MSNWWHLRMLIFTWAVVAWDFIRHPISPRAGTLVLDYNRGTVWIEPEAAPQDGENR